MQFFGHVTLGKKNGQNYENKTRVENWIIFPWIYCNETFQIVFLKNESLLETEPLYSPWGRAWVPCIWCWRWIHQAGPASRGTASHTSAGRSAPRTSCWSWAEEGECGAGKRGWAPTQGKHTCQTHRNIPYRLDVALLKQTRVHVGIEHLVLSTIDNSPLDWQSWAKFTGPFLSKLTH